MARLSATSPRLLCRSISDSRLRPLSECRSRPCKQCNLLIWLWSHVLHASWAEHVKRERGAGVQRRADLEPPFATAHLVPGSEVGRLLTVEGHEL
jgi:hypothetical protein